MEKIFQTIWEMSLFAVLGVETSFGEEMALVEPKLRSSPLVSCMAPPCPQKRPHTFLNKTAAYSIGFSAFWSLPRLSTKTDVLLNVFIVLPHIFNNIAGLAVQQITDRFQRSPRHHLPASYLLEH